MIDVHYSFLTFKYVPKLLFTLVEFRDKTCTVFYKPKTTKYQQKEHLKNVRLKMVAKGEFVMQHMKRGTATRGSLIWVDDGSVRAKSPL